MGHAQEIMSEHENMELSGPKPCLNAKERKYILLQNQSQ